MIGGTISPCEGFVILGYYSESKEAVRQAVNKWIRTSGSFDAVIDFDAVLRDPNHPSRLLPRLASPDHLHPNDVGYSLFSTRVAYSRLVPWFPRLSCSRSSMRAMGSSPVAAYIAVSSSPALSIELSAGAAMPFGCSRGSMPPAEERGVPC